MRYMLIHAADPDLAANWDDGAQAAFASWIEETIRTRVNQAELTELDEQIDGHRALSWAGMRAGALQGALAERRRDLLKTPEHVLMEPDHLGDDDVGIFAVLRQALHHGAEQRLREPGRAIQRLFDGEPSRSLDALHLRPDFLEQHAGPPGRNSGIHPKPHCCRAAGMKQPRGST